jgi:hypothetical protein
MVREKWEEIVAYYKTYIGVIQPLLNETRATVLSLDPEIFANPENLDEILNEENKRKLGKVKVIAEFSALFRAEIFNQIKKYLEEIKEKYDPLDIRDYVVDFLDEAIQAFDVLINIANDEPSQYENSLLYRLCKILAGFLLPQGNTLNEIYDSLLSSTNEWYECQRYIIKPTTFFREEISEMEIPGISPKAYQIINTITSLFNLDPNYVDLPGSPDTVVPAIMISDVFDAFIDNIAQSEEEAIKRICERMELQLIDEIFIGPTEFFLELTEPHNFIVKQKDSDEKWRWIPRFSNETLVLLYLAKVSYRRGFLSKELINWIALNFAFVIYNAILHTFLSEGNIFYNLFLDLKTEEKILPYLMKLLCFDKYLRLDRSQIRDSPSYRKEIFTFLGSKIEAIDKLTYYLVDNIQELFEKTNKN